MFDHTGVRGQMATMSEHLGWNESQISSNNQEDRLKLLYPMVNEDETPLPRSWSPKDKFTYIGLSQNNLRVHYKGRKVYSTSLLCCLCNRVLRTALILLHRTISELFNF